MVQMIEMVLLCREGEGRSRGQVSTQEEDEEIVWRTDALQGCVYSQHSDKHSVHCLQSVLCPCLNLRSHAHTFLSLSIYSESSQVVLRIFFFFFLPSIPSTASRVCCVHVWISGHMLTHFCLDIHSESSQVVLRSAGNWMWLSALAFFNSYFFCLFIYLLFTYMAQKPGDYHLTYKTT